MRPIDTITTAAGAMLILTGILTAMKTTGVVALSWWAVLAPFAVLLLLAGFVALAALIVGADLSRDDSETEDYD